MTIKGQSSIQKIHERKRKGVCDEQHMAWICDKTELCQGGLQGSSLKQESQHRPAAAHCHAKSIPLSHLVWTLPCLVLLWILPWMRRCWGQELSWHPLNLDDQMWELAGFKKYSSHVKALLYQNANQEQDCWMSYLDLWIVKELDINCQSAKE